MISDYTFFTQIIDTSKGKELEKARDYALKEDYQKARDLFAKHIKKSLDPKRFFSSREFRTDDIFLLPNESKEEAIKRILRNELISCGIPHDFNGPIDFYLNPTHNNYNEWTWQLSRHADWKFLARAYREDKDERYVGKIVEFFKQWYQQAIAPELDVSGHATKAWRTIEAGVRMGGCWPYVLHSIYESDLFDTDTLVDWYKSSWEHGRRLRNNHMAGNWLIIEMHGLSYLGMIFDVFKDSKDWLEYALKKLEEELEKQVYPDGFQYELSTNYQNVVCYRYLDIVNKALAYSFPVPESFVTKLETMYSLYYKIVMPNGILPNLNDGKWADINNFIDKTKGVLNNIDKAMVSNFLPYSGFAIMRGQPDFWALFDLGPFGTSHQHEDKLNILVYAYGKLLLTEGGNYAYDSSPMRAYIGSTRSHNTIRVDDSDQNRRCVYRWKQEDIGKKIKPLYYTDDDIEICVGKYDEGYGPNAKINVTHTRTLVFLKSIEEKCFLVIDRLYPKDDKVHTYQILWQLGNDKYLIEDNNILSFDDNSPYLYIKNQEIDSAKTRVVVGQTAPYYQGFRPMAHMVQGSYRPSPTGIREITRALPFKHISLLVPWSNKNIPNISVIASSDVDDNDIKVVFENGKEIYLERYLESDILKLS